MRRKIGGGGDQKEGGKSRTSGDGIRFFLPEGGRRYNPLNRSFRASLTTRKEKEHLPCTTAIEKEVRGVAV